MTFIFRTGQWRIHRVMRDQVNWNQERHKAQYQYAVSLSNGAFVAHGQHRLLLVAWILAHYNARTKKRLGHAY